MRVWIRLSERLANRLELLAALPTAQRKAAARLMGCGFLILPLADAIGKGGGIWSE
jgi:hypothetical protein